MRPPSVEGGGLLAEVALLLGVLGALLVVVALVTAERPRAAVPGPDGYLDRWQALHGGHDPRTSRVLRGWLAATYRLARPLASVGVKPNVLTAGSVWLAALAVLPAAVGGVWPVVGGGLIVASGLVDALDGGVAALTGRATRLGYVLDSVVDRVNELVYLAIVVIVGGPAWLAVACAALFLFHDYLRARAGGAGAGEVVAVTLGERAHRVIVLATTVVVAGVVTPAVEVVATLGLGLMAAFAAVGLGQLAYAVTRQLAAADAADADAAR